MFTELFRNRYRIPSARATWHDYSGGKYFVTICTGGRQHSFGEIGTGKNDEPQMSLTPIGQFVNEQIRNVSTHYPYAEIPLWTVMPNHIHLIVLITPVETMCTSSQSQECTSSQSQECTSPQLQECTSSPQNIRLKDKIVNEKMQTISQKRGLLYTTIGGLKRAITHFARENAIPFIWQPRFHDHIIRNQDEMNGIAEYIENNVANWESDVFYTM